jgi:alpha-mannosidase
MMTKQLILVCNSHIDPVWLWEWEEGLAETLSTFRIAARFCEEFDGFVFNHNESILYRWVEEYEPELFVKIQELVKKGKWHIMGGWYLQPDCNLPSGESFVRQILAGKHYFNEKFAVEPLTAINLDPFGHTRGLVQILKKSGYSSYLFCRPHEKDLHLPGNRDDFVWVGYDGSEILTHRASDHYNSFMGKAGERVTQWLKANRDRQSNTGLLLWGIGNHGGGPSKKDLEQIRLIIMEEKHWHIRHGNPEDYFASLEKERHSLERHQGDLNPWAVGCYTSMALVKQKHRLLENRYFSTEKMLANTALQGLMDYPREKLREALEDLLFCEFHDILPGSAISAVEAYALQRMNHGLEILDRLKSKAFFALLSGHKPADEGEFPIFIYNPHPHDMEEIVECEFQPQEPNFNPEVFWMPEIKDADNNIIPFQLEKESCNIIMDQRKRVVFRGKLKAAAMNRFSCRLKEIEPQPQPEPLRENMKPLHFESDTCEVEISPRTGLIDVYKVKGVDFLNRDSFQPLVMKDYPDPWGMKVRGFRDIEGLFMLTGLEESAEFSGVPVPQLEPLRIIENGPIRSIVEALFRYNGSYLCLRYKIPKRGSEIEIEVRVYWMEKDRMLKLSIPTCFPDGQCRGQVAYGMEVFDRPGEELVAQKWIGMASSGNKHALTIINNCIHGFDFKDGKIGLSLLRSAAYSGLPMDDDLTIVRRDRFEPRIDQGERFFKFGLNAGSAEERFSKIDREALVKNESPMPLCCFPPGTGKKPMPGVTLSDSVVQLTALKMAENHQWLILRLFEPTGKERQTRITIPYLDLGFDVSLKPFEIKSLAVDIQSMNVFSIDLLERVLD